MVDIAGVLRSEYVLFGDVYRNKRVLVTGHTGFKGSWLCLWLRAMGAEVLGYSLRPDTNPSHFELIENQLKMQSVFADVGDLEILKATFEEFEPDIVFHLAAQPLVRLSYTKPIETLYTNVIGTANVFEAIRATGAVQAVVNITSDKCYDNKEWVWGYRETDPMGGYDPYSASKGCAELVTSAYRNSFFNESKSNIKRQKLLASGRAGNVIGGGDWAQDRIITDMMKAASRGEVMTIRNPEATRPWQHVLEPLSGYLLLGQHLLDGKAEYAQAWNFGPSGNEAVTVFEVVLSMKACWSKIEYSIDKDAHAPHEAHMLKLDCSKARLNLGWTGIWGAEKTFEKTVDWYRNYYEEGKISSFDQLLDYMEDAIVFDSCWIKKSDQN